MESLQYYRDQCGMYSAGEEEYFIFPCAVRKHKDQNFAFFFCNKDQLELLDELLANQQVRNVLFLNSKFNNEWYLLKEHGVVGEYNHQSVGTSTDGEGYYEVTMYDVVDSAKRLDRAQKLATFGV